MSNARVTSAKQGLLGLRHATEGSTSPPWDQTSASFVHLVFTARILAPECPGSVQHMPTAQPVCPVPHLPMFMEPLIFLSTPILFTSNLHTCVSIDLCTNRPVHSSIHVSMCLTTHPSTHAPVQPSIYPSIYSLHVHPSMHSSFHHLFMYLPLCPFIPPLIYAPIYPSSIYLSIHSMVSTLHTRH